MKTTRQSWAIILVTALIFVSGIIYTARNSGESNDQPPTNTLDSGAEPIAVNTLDHDVPPQPSLEDSPLNSGGNSTSLIGDAAGPSGETQTGGPGVAEPPELPFDVPKDPVSQPQQVAQEKPRLPVVWVTEPDAQAYTQPGFNMPVARKLEQWEELLIVEASGTENWDRVQDLKGQQFWVQKKILTIIRPQNLSQPSIAEKKVMDFYTLVAHRQHSDAYVHLSPEWKRELSFDDFVKGYSRTDSLRSEIVNVFELGEDRYQVDVAMEAIEEGESVDYLGIYTVEKVDGKWYLTSGSLNKQAKRF